MLDRQHLGDHASQGRAEQAHVLEFQRAERPVGVTCHVVHGVGVGEVPSVVEQVQREVLRKRSVGLFDCIRRAHHAGHARARQDDQRVIPTPEL